MREEYGAATEFGERVLVVAISTAALSESREVTLARSRIEGVRRGEEDGIVEGAVALDVRGGYAVIKENSAGYMSIDSLQALKYRNLCPRRLMELAWLIQQLRDMRGLRRIAIDVVHPMDLEAYFDDASSFPSPRKF